MNTEQIIELIEEAFKGVTLDGGTGLLMAKCADDYFNDEEAIVEAIEFDEKEDWHNIDSEDLKSCESSLSFFDAKGMRFHLPAFIIADIKGELECGTIFHLTELDKYCREQFSLLNSKQKIAVASFLEWYINRKNCSVINFERGKYALEKFWKP